MNKILKQVINFIGFSGIGWLFDMFIYTILGTISNNLFINNMISSCCAASFVFIFASTKIFTNKSNHLSLKYTIYIIYQCICIYLISKLLVQVNILVVSYATIELVIKYASLISKMLITPITMVINFFVLKYLIEKI